MESVDFPGFPISAKALSQYLDATLLGDGEIEIRELAPLGGACSGTLSFFANRKYGADLERVNGAVVLTSESLARPELPVTYILVEDPQRAFARIAKELSPKFPWTGVSPQAVVHPTAALGPDVSIGPFAVIGENVRIGAGTRLGAYVYVGAGTVIGERCEFYPRVTVLDRVVIGNRVKIFPGTVIGADGFGYFTGGGVHTEMPQVGTVVIEDDVRIGANSTVDRATLGTTRVGRGTKTDDHVHVGHNCQVGPNCLLCGAVALGGSVTLEENVVLAGQVGVGHGCTIGKNARLGGQCGTTTNLQGDETYSLMPATPIKEVTRIIRYWRRLPEIWKRLRRVEKQLGINEGTGEA